MSNNSERDAIGKENHEDALSRTLMVALFLASCDPILESELFRLYGEYIQRRARARESYAPDWRDNRPY